MRQRSVVGDDAVFGRFVLVDHEAAADGVVVARGDDFAGSVVSGEAHAVGVERQFLPLVHQQVALFLESDHGTVAVQAHGPLTADAFERAGNHVRVDRVRTVAFQPEQHRLVGAMAAAGEGQRTEDLGRIRATRPRSPGAASQRWTNRAAARIGPTVCEELGPMPILNRSKVLTAIRAGATGFPCIVLVAHATWVVRCGTARVWATLTPHPTTSVRLHGPLRPLPARRLPSLRPGLAVLALARLPEPDSVFIDDDAALEARYGQRVPVLRNAATGAELEWPFAAEAVRAWLA